MKRLTDGTWVVVADGRKAMVFDTEVAGGTPMLHVREEQAQFNPPDRDQATDRPGSAGNRGDGTGSSMEETDFQRQGKERFATDLADWLYHRAHEGAFDRLVIAAPPVVLGAMRPALHKEVSDRVIAEVPKTLTGHPVPDIARILAADLAEAD
ncbi:baeRF12 domain-containing protein [Frigidibacter oleivorans]|uniref:baeRF12 domain-containing protein n=1 Tax=Frigidibacter oleivorans TaxID=2487129 RepID=UPI000F8D7CA6|nr:host attachment family protein [Frigidibacter oleivorans]